MCKYVHLAENKHGNIRYCRHCKTYSVGYSNLLINLSDSGMELFKIDLMHCYDYHIEHQYSEYRDLRNVTIATGVEGLSFLFSTNEVGELLALIQEAQMNMAMSHTPSS
ncbi:MAG: DUF6686 family protein [Bacteroidota bacterium]